jgi:tRNA pseudouridine55 synthase
MKTRFQPNKIYQDDFGRASGIFLANKPKGITSHDVVYRYRKKLQTKKVGHAGALDPFASGLLIILAGKATPLSADFLNLDKEYIADILFGVETNSGDIEGEVINYTPQEFEINLSDLETTLKTFRQEYNQFVPVFSSVKVQGQKLRELARKHNRFEILESDGVKTIRFFKKTEEEEKLVKVVNLPSKNVNIYEIELQKSERLSKDDLVSKYALKFDLQNIKYTVATVRIKCSKGTYIRQLAVDIGVKLGVPAMLVALQRTQIGEYSVENSESI